MGGRVIGGWLEKGYGGRILAARGPKQNCLLVGIPELLAVAVEISSDVIEILT